MNNLAIKKSHDLQVTQKLKSLKSKKSQIKHMARKSKMFTWIQSYTKINITGVLRKAWENSRNVQSNDQPDLW